MKRHLTSGNMYLFLYFIVLAFSGSFLLQLPFAYVSKSPVSYIDALFTAMSAVCVTGLSTVSMDVYTRFGFIIIGCLIEAGGLGLLTWISLFIAIPQRKVSLVNRRIIRDFFIEDVEVNPRKIIKEILIYTLSIQIVGSFILMPLLKSRGVENWCFDAFFLAVSAFCNAGFSVYSDSLIRFDNAFSINITIMCLIVLGGIGFVVIRNLFQTGAAHIQHLAFFRFGKKRRKSIRYRHHLTMHTKLVLGFTAFLIFCGGVIYLFSDQVYTSFGKRLAASFFQSVTTRTAGFETLPQSSFSSFSSFFTIMLMFIGGSPGSIAGGVKTTTIFVLLLYAFHGDDETGAVKIGNRRISMKTVLKALKIVVKSFILVLGAIFLLSIAEYRAIIVGSMTVFEIAFETVSAFATVGLSLGVTSHFSVIGKIILIVVMFAGRTAFVTMGVLFPGQRMGNRGIEYPTATVMCG